MTSINHRTRRCLLMLAAAALGGACIASSPAASDSTPQMIVVTGEGTTGSRDSDVSLPTLETSGLTPTWTLGAISTATATITQVTLIAGQELSCVKGPHWILYDWVAKILEGETVTLLARSPSEWPDYFYIRKSDGTECWAFGGSSTTTGDVYSLPVREAPPLPEVTYVIDNKTGLFIIDVFIRGKDEAAWGADRLGASAIIPGGSFSLTLTAGIYDVKILDYAGGTVYEVDDRPIGANPDYQTALLDLEVDFYIQNNYPFSVCAISVRLPGGSWKALRSPTDAPIATGARANFRLLSGRYEMDVYRCTGPAAGPIATRYIGPAASGLNIPPP